jgi:Zn-dependent M28 family amino/carboxypeptidase
MKSFDAAGAFSHLEALVKLGPRSNASVGHERAMEYIESRLRDLNLKPARQTFVARTPVGMKQFTNIIADLPGSTQGFIVVGAHYDTKPLPFPFLGANDGASGCAVVLETARIFAESHAGLSIRFIFFDGEEAFVRWGPSDSCYGSRYYVEKLDEAGRLQEILAMILVDMVGDADLCLEKDSASSDILKDLFWTRARALGLGRFFGTRSIGIEDDHIPFLDKGIPSLDLIDFAYGKGGLDNSYWHSPDDTLDHVSRESLEVVGRVLQDCLTAIQRNPGLLRR